MDASGSGEACFFLHSRDGGIWWISLLHCAHTILSQLTLLKLSLLHNTLRHVYHSGDHRRSNCQAPQDICSEFERESCAKRCRSLHVSRLHSKQRGTAKIRIILSTCNWTIGQSRTKNPVVAAGFLLC